MSDVLLQRIPKILIVDDSLSDILVMQKALAGLGEIYNAASGLQALEQIRLLKPEIVLLDIEMPDVNGLDICQTIRDDAELANTRVIFVTVHEDDHTEYLSFKSGADEYLIKPYNMNICRFRVQNQIKMYFMTEKLAEMHIIADTIPVPVSLWSRNGDCVYFNHAMLTRLNKTAEQLAQSRIKHLLGDDLEVMLTQQLEVEPRYFELLSHPEADSSNFPIKGHVQLLTLPAAAALILLTLL